MRKPARADASGFPIRHQEKLPERYLTTIKRHAGVCARAHEVQERTCSGTVTHAATHPSTENPKSTRERLSKKRDCFCPISPFSSSPPPCATAFFWLDFLCGEGGSEGRKRGGMKGRREERRALHLFCFVFLPPPPPPPRVRQEN